MEENPVESDDDVQKAHRTTLLWEKQIQQSIVVDLSEDESLHLSDLQASSLAFHLTQEKCARSEASVHLNESAERSVVDDTYSGFSVVRSENIHSNLQRHNTMQDEETMHQEYEDPGQNTSDEDQEDLPYDGELGSPYFTRMVNVISDEGKTVLQSPENVEKQATLPQEVASEGAPTHTRPAVDLNQLLLRHLVREDLLPIEAETLPEVSLLESVDDLLCSASTCVNTAALSSISEREKPSEETYPDNTSPERKVCDVLTRDVSHLRRRSFGDIKYGQGQVHYPLPDFSKVAPKVKIPKASTCVPQVPSPMIRAQSSPEMLDVISRVLEDSGQPSENPQLFKDTHQQTGPAPRHHLQAEYDKLLAKYGQAENLIDRMRLGSKPSSDICIENEENDTANLKEGSHVGPVASHIPTPVENQVITSDEASDAEKMAAELRDIISQFMQTVDDFKQRVSNRSLSTKEQQTMLRSLTEAQDQLERKYMSKKEEHRSLEMQNNLGLSRNIGSFDPNRLVEGDIFRVGMHLEDIKEMIDKNMCEQIIPPLLLSTPKAVTMKTTPPSSLHEGSSAALTTECLKMATQTNTEKRTSGEDELLDEMSELITDDVLKSSNRLSVFPVEGHPEAEGEAERKAGIGSSQQWTPGSGTQDGIQNSNLECDFVDGVSLLVGSSSPDACSPSLSQGIVCRETDSGFGSSYFIKLGGTLQPISPTESVHSDGLSASDSEGSSLNLQTTIHPSDANSWQRTSVNSPVRADAVDLWVQSTTKDSVKLLGSDASHHYTSEAMNGEPNKQHQCSCDGVVIQALQEDVRELKKNLEGLAQKMDYLAFKYRQERRSNSKPRTYQKLSRWQQTSQLRREDWISTDMDPSKSKGTDSSCTSCSEMTLRLHYPPAGGDRGNSVSGQLQEKLQTNGVADSSCTSRSEMTPRLHYPPAGGDRVNSVSGQFQEKLQANGVSDGSTFGLMESCSKRERDNPSKQRTQKANLERWCPSTQRAFLQVGNASSCSLPASYEVTEPPVYSLSRPRKRSTHSDTALLPSNVYFQQTLSRPGNRQTGRKEGINATLCHALEEARNLNKKADHMFRRLTEDLVQVQILSQECVQHSASRRQDTTHHGKQSSWTSRNTSSEKLRNCNLFNDEYS
ncbi:uncharacterized protein LOC133631210 [Entelurus aequoreus]|uniref:uncharacterized protein LOC133631210 n=1 Tax=Entelurus aequoreus TaxID=161455 RepID=UPI002B1D326B|nr:uncharacterized protein LOC133631210 [Entelurus aequoreus]